MKVISITVMRLLEDAHFLSLMFETSKEFEGKLRVRLVLGTFPETPIRNHHLSFIFHQFLRHTIKKCATQPYCSMSIVLGKNKHV